MATYVTDSQNYEDIASAIRTAQGSQNTFLPSEMAAAIATLPPHFNAYHDVSTTSGTYTASTTGTHTFSTTISSASLYIVSFGCATYENGSPALNQLTVCIADSQGNIITQSSLLPAITVEITSTGARFVATISAKAGQTYKYSFTRGYIN